jgi:hypothetical protein
MSQFTLHLPFIKFFASIMAPITKLLKKTKVFQWTNECQTIWEYIKNWNIQVPICINLNWELEFHVHTNASRLAIGAILTQNPTCKIKQLVCIH